MQIQGHQIDKVKGRFTGTIDEVDDEIFKFDRMVVMLVVARTSVGSIDPKDDGEIHAVMKIKVSDMQALEGDLRDQAIAYLAHGADQGILHFGQPVHKPPRIKGQKALEVEAPVADYAEPPPGVDVNGEVPARVVQDPDEEFDVPVAAPLPVTARATDAEPPAFVAPAAEALSPDEENTAPPAGAQRVGTIRAPRKDEALSAFLNE